MAVNPAEVVATIRRALAEGLVPLSNPTHTEEPESVHEYPAAPPERKLFETLEHGPLRPLRETEQLDRPAGGWIHRLVFKFIRPFLHQQARFNRASIEATEIAAGDLDQLRTKQYYDVKGVYERLIQLEDKIHEDRVWADEIHHRHHLLAQRFAEAEQTIAELRQELAAKADRELLAAEVARLQDALAGLPSGADLDKLWGEIPKLYGSIEARAGAEDVAKLRAEIPRLYASIEARASGADVAKLWAEIPNLYRSVEARAAGEDLARLWEVIPKLQTGIEERASAADVAKLWNEIPGLVRAIDERAAQSDVSKLWSEIPRLHQAVAERGSQADVAQLFQQLELRATWAALEAQQQALSACNAGTDERIDAIWEGLAQRDRQVAQDTTAIQHLHRRDAEVREQMRGTVARLELLADQVALAQELVNGTAPVATPRAVSASAAPVVQDPAPIDSILQKQLDMAYLRFQRLHRGEEQELRARFARYPELIARLLPAGARCLDVACGDGLLLSLLGQQGFATQGVDLNETMVRHARERGLAVGHGDGIAFLESAEVASVDCVSALQFIEHLQPAQFMRFLRAAFRVLRPGGMILLETINPHSMRAWHWYFMDLTHARLIYPEITVLFAESVGFRAAEWHGINPAAEEERLVVPLAEGTEKRNAERLNKILYGPQDYFFIARKASTQ